MFVHVTVVDVFVFRGLLLLSTRAVLLAVLVVWRCVLVPNAAGRIKLLTTASTSGVQGLEPITCRSLVSNWPGSVVGAGSRITFSTTGSAAGHALHWDASRITGLDCWSGDHIPGLEPMIHKRSN